MARQQRAIRTRARIIAAAGECFSESGYRATRVADVAERAGAALGTLLFHFPAKTDIANAVIEQQHRIVMEAATAVEEMNSPSGIDDIIVVSAKLANLISTNPTVRAGLRLSTESVDDLGISSAQPYLDWTRQCIHLLEKARAAGEVAEGVNLEHFAEVINSAFTGTQFMSSAVSGSQDLPERLAKLWPILFSQVVDADYSTPVVQELLDRHAGLIVAETPAEAESSSVIEGA
ncbi:hypothetical protein BMH32_02075 [Leucobacter sp. OLJS4]|uniref:ScbR family autoregulator-binding transcription factor n=1 Tax=unclassified Leucobacter TaxID=2621730 RepID=UPI000C4DC9AF|nr:MULTISPECIES: ScbR family autoregulator-binding transcription factor [unclassified Leucobacter]PII82949.1 hypothetical protein BMH25_09505 [Leucobacter sp. OLCALW19]PII91614.1 hypothetical protein BMH26_02880 [Leucobacter sp. OLTLW20]PII91800.1 hypothetical protein BMH27_06680 [Leucobacter sp. OLAS13]PIJ00122.1 hypothetical protein BMH29_01965 [Leucobacter sp. OLDS2]PIJ00383.1 hypothetical protein BMH28_09505 [Leucobacter sp. OLCS4]